MFKINQIPEYSWTELHRLEFELDLILGALKESIQFNDELIIKKRERIKQLEMQHEFLNSDADWQSKAQYYALHFGEEQTAIYDLQQVLLSSNLLSAFALFEGKLKEVCQLVEQKIESNIKHIDLKAEGGDLGQIWKYLVSVYGMDGQTLKPKFDFIQKHKKIRNKIAHSRGEISNKDVKSIKGIKNIKLNENWNDTQQIIIESSVYLKDLISLIEDFFKKLIVEIDNQMQNYKGLNSKF